MRWTNLFDKQRKANFSFKLLRKTESLYLFSFRLEWNRSCDWVRVDRTINFLSNVMRDWISFNKRFNFSITRQYNMHIVVTIIFKAKLRLKLDFSPGCNLKTKTPTKTLYLFLFLNPKTSVWNNLWIWTFFITFIHNN